MSWRIRWRGPDIATLIPRCWRVTPRARACVRRENSAKTAKAALEKDAERQRLTIPVLHLMIDCNQLLWKVPIALQTQIDEALASRQTRTV